MPSQKPNLSSKSFEKLVEPLKSWPLENEKDLGCTKRKENECRNVLLSQLEAEDEASKEENQPTNQK